MSILAEMYVETRRDVLEIPTSAQFVSQSPLVELFVERQKVRILQNQDPEREHANEK